MTDHDADWIPGLVGLLRVKPGSRVRLPADFDPGATLGVRKKDDGLSLLRRGMALLAEYQERLAAQETYGVLVVLQALDAAGKDSTIRHVMSGVNPQGVKVSSFKAPSAEELSHDYLWRHARRLPPGGEIGISTRRTTRRSSWSACTRSSPTPRGCPASIGTASGSAATRRSTTGSATWRITASGW